MKYNNVVKKWIRNSSIQNMIFVFIIFLLWISMFLNIVTTLKSVSRINLNDFNKMMNNYYYHLKYISIINDEKLLKDVGILKFYIVEKNGKIRRTLPEDIDIDSNIFNTKNFSNMENSNLGLFIFNTEDEKNKIYVGGKYNELYLIGEVDSSIFEFSSNSFFALQKDNGDIIYSAYPLQKINKLIFINGKIYVSYSSNWNNLKMITFLDISGQLIFSLIISVIMILSILWDFNSNHKNVKSMKRLSASTEELEATNKELEDLYLQLEGAYNDLESSYRKFSAHLSYIAEKYDEITGNHIDRVAHYSKFIAEKMGFDANFVKDIESYAPLHDIGKLMVKHEILNKPGGLSRDEYEEMKKHTIYAEEIFGDDERFKMAKNIAKYHHECYDGSGYPYGLKGEEIPIEARIVSLADIYDALRSERPYKTGYNHEETYNIIVNGDFKTKPTIFDPGVLKVFKEYHLEFDRIYNEYKFKELKNVN